MLERLERPTVYGDGIEDGLEVRRRPERETRSRGEKAHALRRGALSGNDARRLGIRPQLGQARFTGRRDRQTRDHGHDAVELEGSQGARIHLLGTRQCTRWSKARGRGGRARSDGPVASGLMTND